MTTTRTKFEIYFKVYKSGTIKVIKGPGNYYIPESERSSSHSIGESFEYEPEDAIIKRVPKTDFDKKFGFNGVWTMKKEPYLPGLYYGQATLSVSVCYIPGEPTDYDYEFTLDSFEKVDKIITQPRILRFIDPQKEHMEYLSVIAR